jgi:hypothetical protein
MSLVSKLRLRSLAYLTDLAILGFQGRIEDKGDYIVAESIGNPGYFWGNLLVMRNAPRDGDFQVWIKLFEKEFAHQPLIKHMTFGWDSPEALEGECQPFIREGFALEKSVVLTLRENGLIQPKHLCPELEIRTLRSDEEWEQAIQNQVTCREDSFKQEMYLPFKRIQMKKYRDMSEAGLGNWYGAFLNNELVADCGLFIFDKIGRFQAVGTHPEFRNRGICGNLIYQISQEAFLGKKVENVVMVADPEYHAARVYESVGFQPTENAIGMYRWPKEDWTAS